MDNYMYVIGTTPIIPGATMIWNRNMKPVNMANFLLAILFVLDNTQMERHLRTGNHITWISDGQISISMF
jgi:hypothetical protein